MDDQPSFSSPPPPPQMAQQPQMMVPMGFMPGMRPTQSPGRPNGNPEAQAMRDRQSQAMSELNELLPKQAKETRFHIYRLSRQRGTWIKTSSRPDNKIYLSEWKDLGLTETDALRAYLREKLGPGCYQITACDAHGSPMPRTPSWTEDLYQEGDDNMNGPINDSHARGRGGRGRFRRGDRGAGGRDLDDDYDDLDDDYDDIDYLPERRGNGGGIMDFIQTTKAVEGSAAAAAQAAAQAQQASQQDTMRMLMLQSQQQRDADDRRRSEEAAREERRREERRAEEVRNEERRREERKEDERRREEERRQDREREERNAQSRTAMISGIITAAVSVLPTMLAPKKDDTMVVLLSKLMEPKPQDPMMATLLAKIMDSSNQKTGIDTMLAGMAKVQEVGAEMQAKQMQSVMNTSQELQGKLMQQVIANLKNGSGDESTFDKILKGLPALLPLVQAASTQQPAAPAAQPRPVITQAPAQVPAAQPPTTTPQTVAQAQPEMPKGYDLVAKVMIALQTKRYDTETQRSELLDLLVANAPEELKHAIAKGDQAAIMTLCAPTFTANAEYMTWLQSQGAMDFIMATAGGLQPQFAAQLGYVLEQAPVEAPQPAPQPAPEPVVHDAVVVTSPDVG